MQENRKSLIVQKLCSIWRRFALFFQGGLFWRRVLFVDVEQIESKSLICKELRGRDASYHREFESSRYHGFCISFLFLVLPFLEILSHKTLLLGVLASAALGEFVLFGGLYSHHRWGLQEVLLLLLAIFYVLSGIGAVTFVKTFVKGCASALWLLLCFPALLVVKKRDLDRMLFSLSFGLFAVSFYGVFQYCTGKAELKWVDLSHFSDIGGRSTSFFSNPNFLAVYLLLCTPLMTVFFLDRSRRRCVRTWSFVVFSLACACLIFTWSRGAWLGAILAVCAFVLLWSVKSRAWASLAAIPLLAISFYLPKSILNRLFSIGTMNDSSTRYRFYVWKGVTRTIAANPFGIGVGEEAFSSAYLPFAVSGSETVMHTHQLFLQICLEIGWGGAIAFLLMLLIVFFLFLKRRKNGSTADRLVRLSTFCALIGCLTMGLFDHVWYHAGDQALFWSVLGLLLAGCKKEDLV